jgi:hypothetical protein
VTTLPRSVPLVLNDEAHHCYRAKPEVDEISDLKGDEKEEAKKNNEAARLWVSGLEIVKRKLGITRVMDLSATPFFLRGSGYAEGTLFPWTMSDFSLMDAIECGIVKLPRVPVADNIPGGDMPKFRNLWEHIRTKMPKKGRGPPCFIVICQNTSISKLVYDYISGFQRKNEDGSTTLENGRLVVAPGRIGEPPGAAHAEGVGPDESPTASCDQRYIGDRGKHSALTWQAELSFHCWLRRPPAHLGQSFANSRIHRDQSTATDVACSGGTYSKCLAAVRLLFDSSSLRLKF